MSTSVDPNVIAVALDRVDGHTFEHFVNDIYPRIEGFRYIPCGGFRDGGADGIGGDPIHERETKPTHFYQASVQQDPEKKIRHTVRRLKEYGRTIERLTYVTARLVNNPDAVEARLSDELDVAIRIHSQKYIQSWINHSGETQASYRRHLARFTDDLKHIGSNSLSAPSSHVVDPTIFVFLRQEVDRRSGSVELLESLVDSLILWSLEGTDPDKGVLMTSAQILEKILKTLPASRQEVEQRLEHRLRLLSSKKFPGGRRIKYHAKDRAYVLPFETRQTVEPANAEDEALSIRFRQSVRERADSLRDGLDEKRLKSISDVVVRAFQLSFEERGMMFSQFLDSSPSAGGTTDYPALAEAINTAAFELGITVDRGGVQDDAVAVSRSVLYFGNEDEREYLRRLSRTYILLFTFKNDPRVVSFFNQLASRLYLYVGTDMLVRALSEALLPNPNRLAQHTLEMASQAGVQLVLSEPVLEELVGNIRSADDHYIAEIQQLEPYLTPDLIEVVPKVLLRTYLYNRTRPECPHSWQEFVAQFCTYSDLHKPSARGELRVYLAAKYGMQFIGRHELLEASNHDERAEIEALLRDVKPQDWLAENDALLISSVYSHRAMRGELMQPDEFGLGTWWLTSETRVLDVTGPIQSRHEGADYIMRPDYLLNFLTLSPSAATVREAYSSIFPGVLGVQISRQLSEASYREVMATATEAITLDPARRTAVLSKLSDRLKSDPTLRLRRKIKPLGAYGRS